MLAFARHVMLPIFLAQCHILQTMILNNTFFFPPSIKESLNNNLYLYRYWYFQRFFSTYHHPYTIGYYMMNSSNFGVASTRKPPPWPVPPLVPALIAEAKGRGHSTCEGWVTSMENSGNGRNKRLGKITQNNGKPTKETLELFFLKHLKHFYRLSRSFFGH